MMQIKQMIGQAAKALVLVSCCAWGDWKDPELANVRVENAFPWSNEVHYLISFKKDIDVKMFTDSSYLFVGVTWNIAGGSRRDPAQQQWRIPLKAENFVKPQVIDGRKFYRITIDPVDNGELYDFLMEKKSYYLQGRAISIGLFRTNNGDEKHFHRVGWSPFSVGRVDSLVYTSLCPTPESHTISGGIAQTDTGRVDGRPFSMKKLPAGRVASRMPVWVSPTAWGKDPTSSQAAVSIARLNADGTDTDCTYLPMTNITCKTLVTDCSKNMTAPGFFFWQAANTPKLNGTYRMRMKTNGFKPTVITTEFTFTGLSKSE